MERVIADPDFGITLLQELKAERNKVASLETTVAVQTQQIAEMKPKVGYYDIVLRSPSLVKTSVIAKDYGMGAPTFNRLLKKLGIQYKQEQKRIQAKVVNDDNEKYAFRIWLLRIGMNGGEYKVSRKTLMENLSGHTAFRTKDEEDRWKARQKEKREELKAAKAAAEAEETPANAV